MIGCPRCLRRAAVAPCGGFTLVEVLIVLVIIGILTALLLPVFHNARESARATTCLGNLRQIHLAINLYAEDNNGLYPDAGIAGPFCTWIDRIEPYTKSRAIFDCPAFEKAGFPRDHNGCPGPRGDIPTTDESYFGSYDINNIPGRYRAHRFTHPSSTILVLDGDGGRASPGSRRDLCPDDSTLTIECLLRSGVDTRHARGGQDGANVLWADGHVKWTSLQQMTERRLWLISGE